MVGRVAELRKSKMALKYFYDNPVFKLTGFLKAFLCTGKLT